MFFQDYSSMLVYHWSYLVSRFVAGCTRHAKVTEADRWCVLIGRSRIEALVTADDAALQLLDHAVGHVFGQRLTVPAHLILSHWKRHTQTKLRTGANKYIYITAILNIYLYINISLSIYLCTELLTFKYIKMKKIFWHTRQSADAI